MPKAEAAFQAAQAVEPDSAQAHLALARLYLAQRKMDEAEEEFKLAVQKSQVGSWAHLQLVDFYRVTGKREEAKRALGEITRLNQAAVASSACRSSPLSSFSRPQFR